MYQLNRRIFHIFMRRMRIRISTQWGAGALIRNSLWFLSMQRNWYYIATFDLPFVEREVFFRGKGSCPTYHGFRDVHDCERTSFLNLKKSVKFYHIKQIALSSIDSIDLAYNIFDYDTLLSCNILFWPIRSLVLYHGYFSQDSSRFSRRCLDQIMIPWTRPSTALYTQEKDKNAIPTSVGTSDLTSHIYP